MKNLFTGIFVYYLCSFCLKGGASDRGLSVCCFTFQVPKSAGASPDWSQEPRSQLRFPTGEKGPMPRSHLGPPKTRIIGKWKSGTKLRLTPGCAEWGVATPSSIETARPEAFKCAQRKIAKWACVRLSPRLSGYGWWPVLMLCIPAHLCFCHILKHCLNLPAQFCVDRNFQFYDHLSRFMFGFNDPCCFSAFIILISAVLWISFAYFASLGHGVELGLYRSQGQGHGGEHHSRYWRALQSKEEVEKLCSEFSGQHWFYAYCYA